MFLALCTFSLTTVLSLLLLWMWYTYNQTVIIYFNPIVFHNYRH